MAFRPYVPEYALRLLAGRGGEVPPLALREDTAVLLADIAGLTPMSASRDAGRGQVAVDGTLAAGLGVEVAGRRGQAVLVAGLARRPRRPAARPTGDRLAREGDERLAAFLHPAIAERVRRGQAGLVNEHR